MLGSVDSDEKVKIIVPPNILRGYLRPNQEYWFLTEDGLYEVLMQSRKPKAKEFKKEVKKILKSIRKTGGYVVGNKNGDSNIERMRDTDLVRSFFYVRPSPGALPTLQNDYII